LPGLPAGTPIGQSPRLPIVGCSKAGTDLPRTEETMTIGGIITAIIIGLIIGALGRLVVPGKQNIPIWLTIVVGIVAALVGSALVGSLRDTNGVDWVEIIVQIALAAVGVYLVSSLRGRRTASHKV
jgi:uncharacterized membrane protein YeaQ/YmgE (transglycosylase-associated protein family)